MQVTRRCFLQSASAIPALTIASLASAADESPLFTFVVDADPHTSIDRNGELTGRDKFRRILEISDRYPLASTPMFLEFVAGLRDYPCSPWSTVTFTVNGWKAPCYLIGKRYTFDWEEFWTTTDWDYWESRQDALCQNCAMHSGFEASVVMDLPKSAKDMTRIFLWNMTRPTPDSSALTRWAISRLGGVSAARASRSGPEV